LKFDNKFCLVIFIIFILLFSVNSFLEAGLLSFEFDTERIAEIEKTIYGETREENIISQRIVELEYTLFQEQKTDMIFTERADNIINKFLRPGEKEPSLFFVVNTIEWSLNNEVSIPKPLLERVELLEKQKFEKIMDNKGLIERIINLKDLILSDEEILTESIIPADDFSIEIVLSEEISSETEENNKNYEFIVKEDYEIDNVLIIPAGVRGYIKIEDHSSAGFLGTDGFIKFDNVEMEFFDGTILPMELSPFVVEKSYSRELAILASVLGTVVINHPVGLAVGVLVPGQDIVISEGTELQLNLVETGEIQGLKLN